MEQGLDAAMKRAPSDLPALLWFLPGFVKRRIVNRPNLIKILDNIGWLFFDKILRMGVGLIVGVWVARYLGPEQYGLLNYATALVGLIGCIAGLGLQSIVVRDVVRDPASKYTTLGTAAVLQALGGMIAYGLILGTIFWLRPDDSLAKIVTSILGSTMLFKGSEIATYWFESQVISKYTVWVQNCVFLLFAMAKITLILNNAPITAFAWVTVAEALCIAVLTIIVFMLCSKSLHLLRASLARVKTLLADSWPLLLSGIAVMVYMKIDQIMLGEMIGNDAVGIYSAAVRISEIWYFIPMSIVASIFPSMLEIKKNSEEEFENRLQNIYDLMVLISTSTALFMTFFSKYIVVFLFGEKFIEAGIILSIHTWAAVFVFLGVASSQWFLAENRQILNLQRSLSGAVSNIILNTVLIPIYGIHGAASATVISYAIAAMFIDIFRPDTRKMFFMKLKAFNIGRIIFKKL